MNLNATVAPTLQLTAEHWPDMALPCVIALTPSTLIPVPK